jgi:hypothetical protein
LHAGIHAKTLLGRKVQGGKAALLFAAMRASADEADALSRASHARCSPVADCLAECARALREAVATAEEVTAGLTAPGIDKSSALINAHDYLTLMGHTAVAWVWLRSAAAATRGLQQLGPEAEAEAAASLGGGSDEAMEPRDDELSFYLGKLHTCAFFFRHELPKTAPLAQLLRAGDRTVREMRVAWF